PDSAAHLMKRDDTDSYAVRAEEIARQTDKQLFVVGAGSGEEALRFGLERGKVVAVALNEVGHLLRRETRAIERADILLIIEQTFAEDGEGLARAGVRAMQPEHRTRDFWIGVDERGELVGRERMILEQRFAEDLGHR